MYGLASIRAINAWAASPEGKRAAAGKRKNEHDQRAKRLAEYLAAKNMSPTPK